MPQQDFSGGPHLQDHPVRPVDERVSVDRAGKEVFLMAGRLSQRFVVGGKVADGVDEAVACARKRCQVGSQMVARPQLIP